MKKVIVFFDLEGWLESPVRQQFDIEKTVKGISKILENNNTKAVFNCCGKIIEDYPELIKFLYNNGHEIASHGYLHEVFIHLKEAEFNEVLKKTEDITKKTIGEKPSGLRSPGLFFNKEVYRIVKSRGYKWVSNRYMQFWELFNRPDCPRGIFNLHKFATIGSMFEHFYYPKEPYKINSLLEIPLLSSLETDLLGIMPIHQKSKEVWLEFAFNSLKKQYKRSRDYFNLNFHPWLIGTQNRPILLNNILKFINQKKESKFVLACDL